LVPVVDLVPWLLWFRERDRMFEFLEWLNKFLQRECLLKVRESFILTSWAAYTISVHCVSWSSGRTFKNQVFQACWETCWTPYHVITKNVTSASHLHELAYITLDTYTWYYVCNTFILSSRSTIIHSVSWYAQSPIFWFSFIYFLWFNLISLYFNDEETCDYVHMMCHMIMISPSTWL